MGLDENVSRLIGRIYESADDPARWDSVLHEIRAFLGVRCLMQSLSDFDNAEMHTSTVIGDAKHPEGVEEYREHAYQLDDSFRWAIEHPHARFCDTEAIIRRETYLEQDFIQWNRNNWIGSTHWLVGYTPPDDELTFGLSAHPWAEDGPLSGEKKALFRMLFDHMERAIRLRSRSLLMAGEGAALILIDRLGRIREITPAASEIVERNDGLTVCNGELRGANPGATAKLNAAVVSALGALTEGTAGGAVSLPRPSGQRDLFVIVTPLVRRPTPFGCFGSAALLRIVEPKCGIAASAAAQWACLFNLTPAEARLAESLIARDCNLRDAADAVCMSYATARVHLKHLLEKTGTHNQAQLARLLTRVE